MSVRDHPPLEEQEPALYGRPIQNPDVVSGGEPVLKIRGALARPNAFGCSDAPPQRAGEREGLAL